MTDTDFKERIARPVATDGDSHTFRVTLTPTDQVDPVILHLEPVSVLPIILVPGIMGTNLCDIKNDRRRVWNLDATNLPFAGPVPLALAASKFSDGPGRRQLDLHPDRTLVDPGGAVPERAVGSVVNRSEYLKRGWGEVGEASYHAFMCELEELLNKHRTPGEPSRRVGEKFLALMESAPPGGERDAPWRPLKEFVPPTVKEIERMDEWLMPVYACGYNWLQDNDLGAKVLAARIEAIIARHDDRKLSFCKQVVLITHSMGGLVARACAKLPGMESRIAGVVHGVMPANGAAVAYRRCKVGMQDENLPASFVIGKTGQHVTAVFSQSPGALELLPTQNYSFRWLEVRSAAGTALQDSLPVDCPYNEIYSQRDRWWGLIHETWLAPKDGAAITWTTYLRFLGMARRFHASLRKDDYHPNTYAFYGADNTGNTPSFERIVWTVSEPSQTEVGDSCQTPVKVASMTPQEVMLRGVNPESFRGCLPQDPRSHGGNEQWTRYYTMRVGSHNGSGDGTVPASSGIAPKECAKVRQVFRLTGIEHEPAYHHATAQQVTVYSLIKIASDALWPAPFSGAASE